MTTDPISSSSIRSCIQCQKEGAFMCSSCGHDGPRYCSVECQTHDWKTTHRNTCKAMTEQTTEEIQLQDLSQDQEEEEEELADDLRFYTNQIYRIIKPVVACIILSIFWVKVAFSGDSDYTPTRPSYVQVPTTTTTTTTTTTSNNNSNIGSSFINAAIIIGQIIGVTIIIVFLFKKGWIKVLIGFFMIVVVLLLGFMTYLLLLNLIQVFFIPLDYVTMVFGLWNFAMVGLVSIFWKGPLWLQQSYLTIMSSLMAFSLTGLEQWTTWILLGLLAIWDLIAVLCPFGPLRLLIESSKTQQREVPALLYSVNAVWFMMASGDHFRLSNSMLGRHSTDHRQSMRPTSFIRRSHDGFMRLPEETQQQQQQQSPLPAEVEKDEEDVERSGLKLGLGDFVFYSVLIARAAMYDWITTVCCTIAVLTGLTATIFLLAIYKKALPALPISIAFGILFYFVAKQVLVPYIGMVCVFGMVGL